MPSGNKELEPVQESDANGATSSSASKMDSEQMAGNEGGKGDTSVASTDANKDGKGKTSSDENVPAKDSDSADSETSKDGDNPVALKEEQREGTGEAPTEADREPTVSSDEKAVDTDTNQSQAAVITERDTESDVNAPPNQRGDELVASNQQDPHTETTGAGGENQGGEGERKNRETEEERSATTSSTKKHREKRSRKRSKRTSESTAGVPGLRKRASRTGGGSRLGVSNSEGMKHLEVIVMSAFQASDPNGTGYVQPAVFWEVLQSSALNLQLSYEEIAHLQGLIQPDQSGLVPYAEFANRATDIIASLYTNHQPTGSHWVDLTTTDGSVTIIFNKQTGEVMEKAVYETDPFSGVIDDLYKRTDPDGKGYVTWKMFKQLLQSSEMSPFLVDQDIKEMQKQYGSVSNGKASYEEFRSLAKDLVLRVYRARDPTDSPWCKISSPELGEVWFNKFTGETHQGLQTGDSREQEIAFVSQAYAQVEEINFELEQYKMQNRNLENLVAKVTEDQETLEAQLYETGVALDQANAEIISKESVADQMKSVIERKDQQMEFLQMKLSDLDGLKNQLSETQQELQSTRETIANRDSSITERDTNIMSLQKQADEVTDDLKTAHGMRDAHDSVVTKLQHQLQGEQKRLKEFEKAVPELEKELSSAKEQLESSKRTLDEKTAALVQTRRHLKNARERNMDLEKDMEKLGLTHDKLSGAESEIRTLKTFLTTKTALIEKHKKDLKDTRLRVAELEEKDSRRAVILADVLEKTARQYQQQLGQAPRSGGRSPKVKFQTVLDESRPYSAPAVPPEGSLGTDETDFSSSPIARPAAFKSYTTASRGPILTHSKASLPLDQPREHKMRAPHAKIRNRSRAVPKLPPIARPGAKQQKANTFVVPTVNEVKRANRLRDTMLIEHTPSNPQCSCEMCRMNASVVGNTNSRPETGLTGMTAKTAGLPGYQGETDVRELALAEQLRIGQRVVVRMKRSEFDLEATKLTGIIKYVGKIDSEYVDHRIYVGVKLDEAAGDTDGLIKTKRYFTCPPKHGKLVRISNVVAVLPPKSVFYKPLQELTKRSPYTTVQKKITAQ